MSGDCLYRRLLGADFDLMPPAVQALHAPASGVTFTGQAMVESAVTRLGALIARVMRLPPPGEHALRLTIEPQGDAEAWTRFYGTHRFTSTLSLSATNPFLLEERMGFLTVVSRNTAGAGGTTMTVVAARIGPLVLPRWLTPQAQAREDVDAEGRLRFDIRASLPGLGLIVRYTGHLQTPQTQTPR